MEVLREYSDNRGVAFRVDGQAGIIRGVKILGLESKNGRSYLPAALTNAVSLYEGSKVNVNHPAGNPNGPRGYEDRIGVIRNVALRSGSGLFGDFHFNPKHALAEQLIWDAEHAPENVGFSHNVEAKTARRNGKTVVEEITRVQSVDLVADPATTSGLFESATPVAPDPLVAKRRLVEEVAREIGLPDCCIPPMGTGLAYRKTREEITEYLDFIRKSLVKSNMLPPKTTAEFVEAVCGDSIRTTTALPATACDFADAVTEGGTRQRHKATGEQTCGKSSARGSSDFVREITE